MSQKLKLRIVGAPELIDPLAAELRKQPDDVEVTSVGKVEGPTGFEFGLVAAAAIATIMSSGFTLGNLCLMLRNALRKAPDNVNMVKIVTSAGEVEIRWHADLTEEQIRKLIESVAKPG